jgi:RNA polymerase sigma-70 factor, ECF subfamily
MTATAASGRELSFEMADTCAALFDQHRSFLWGLLYRMTGCAADADDLVQESFVRLLEHGPQDDGRPLRPWLVREVCRPVAAVAGGRERRGHGPAGRR